MTTTVLPSEVPPAVLVVSAIERGESNPVIQIMNLFQKKLNLNSWKLEAIPLAAAAGAGRVQGLDKGLVYNVAAL